MFDKIVLSGSILFDVCEQFGHCIKLVVSGEDHFLAFQSPFIIKFLLKMQILEEDLDQSLWGQNLFPEIVGCIAVGIDRVAFASDLSCTI